MVKLRKDLGLAVLALAVLVALFAPDAAAGSRLVVTLDQPFEVNGAVYDGGRISLEQVRTVSPVATLNEVRIDGHSVGLLMAQQHGNADPAAQDELIFARRADGRLVLDSVAFSGQPVRELQDYGPRAVPGHEATGAEGPTLVAANR